MKRIHPTRYDWGRRKGQPWTSDDETCALFLRHCGMANEDIGEIMGRSKASVRGKIGHDRQRNHAVIFEAARSVAAFELGRLVDSFLVTETAGTA